MKEKLKESIKVANPFILFIIIYMILFYVIRLIDVDKYYYPSIPLDSKIPYIKFFVVPYLSWLLWIPFIWIYTLFHDKVLFKKISYMLMISMTLYLVLSFVCPTALSLRPSSLDNTDIWCRLTLFLYSLTPETYVFPSLHVFHSLVIMYAITKGKGKLIENIYFKIFGFIWTILICLSTVFIKQHSIIDVIGGILLFIIILIGFHIYEKGDVLRK